MKAFAASLYGLLSCCFLVAPLQAEQIAKDRAASLLAQDAAPLTSCDCILSHLRLSSAASVCEAIARPRCTFASAACAHTHSGTLWQAAPIPRKQAEAWHRDSPKPSRRAQTDPTKSRTSPSLQCAVSRFPRPLVCRVFLFRLNLPGQATCTTQPHWHALYL